MVRLQLKSVQNSSYNLSVSHLTDAENKVVIQENTVSVSPATVDLVAGQTKEVELLFSGLKIGLLSGNLLLESPSNSCEPITIPLQTEL